MVWAWARENTTGSMHATSMTRIAFITGSFFILFFLSDHFGSLFRRKRRTKTGKQERNILGGANRLRHAVKTRAASRWSYLPNSRNNQARASFQSRITVSDEILSTAAVSCTFRPPK